MMQVIRDRAQGIVSWVIVGMIAVVFCFWGVSGYFTGSSTTSLATVYGKKISSIEVDNLYNRWLRYSVAQKGFDINQIDAKYIKQQITKSLAEQQAVILGLQRNGFTVSDRVLVANIRQDSHLQDNGQFSLDRYKQYLNQANLSEYDFEQTRRDDLMMAQVQQGIVASGFALKSEVQQLIDIKNQKRSFAYAVIPAMSKPGVKISDEQINEYYSKHAASFIEPEKVMLEYVELSIDDLMQKVQVTEAKLLDYYKNNLQAFSEPESLRVRHIMIADSKDAKSKIESIYAKLKQGESFVALAKKESDDKQTAGNGGDLGWVGKNDDLPKEVYSLANNNDYTQPLQTEYGWHIFQLADRKAAKAKDYNSVKKIVEARYKRETAESLFTKEGDELANLAFENPQSLTAASETLHLPIQTTGYFTRQSNTGLAGSKNVLNAAFSDDVLAKRNNSDLIRVSDDSFVVIRVKDAQPQRKLNLPEVREQIVMQLRKEMAEAETKKLGQETLAVINENNTPYTIVRDNLVWRTVRDIKRDDKSVPATIIAQAFSLGKPESGQRFTSTGFSLPNGDYVIVTLTGVSVSDKSKSGTSEANAEDNGLDEAIGRQISMLHGRLEYNSLQASLIDQAKIEYTRLSDN